MPELVEKWACCICGKYHDDIRDAYRCEDQDLRKMFSVAKAKGKGRQFLKVIWLEGYLGRNRKSFYRKEYRCIDQ